MCYCCSSYIIHIQIHTFNEAKSPFIPSCSITFQSNLLFFLLQYTIINMVKFNMHVLCEWDTCLSKRRIDLGILGPLVLVIFQIIINFVHFNPKTFVKYKHLSLWNLNSTSEILTQVVNLEPKLRIPISNVCMHMNTSINWKPLVQQNDSSWIKSFFLNLY